jgi:D-alanyl-D-alanine carboxypeptidase
MNLKNLAINTILISLTLASCQATVENRDQQLLNSVPSLKKPVALNFVSNQQSLPTEKASKLQQLLEDSRKRQNIPGLVMYISTPNGSWTQASGKAIVETETPMQPTARFRIASITKTFVSVVVLQLAQEGKLQLDDKINKFLPKEILTQLPNSNQITIKQLLNHSSGLANYMTPEFYAATRANPPRRWTAQEAIKYGYNLAPVGNPGEKFEYADTNYILLEIIVETVTNSTLTKEIRSRILTPLNMKDTFMEVHESIPGGFANGYRKVNGSRTNVTQLDEGNGLGDGGLISTSEDLAKFIHGLLAEAKLLSPDSLKLMLTFFKNDNYGLGIASNKTGWGQLLGHSGATTGFRSEMYYLPSRDVTVVVLANNEDEEIYGLVEKSLDVLLSEPPQWLKRLFKN